MSQAPPPLLKRSSRSQSILGSNSAPSPRSAYPVVTRELLSKKSFVEEKDSIKRPLEWVQYESRGGPEKRHGHSMVAYGNRFIVFGGLTSILPVNDVWFVEFLGQQCMWRRIEFAEPAMPCKRTGHTSTVIGNKMFVFGGDTLQLCLNDTWVLDLDTQRWEEVSVDGDSPPPRYGHSCLPLGNCVMLFGGANRHVVKEEGSGKTDIVFYADIWLFHTDTNRWEHIPTGGRETPCKRYGHSIAQVENLIYLYGGFVTEGLASSRLSDMWELNPETWTWREIPPQGPAPPKLMNHTCIGVNDQLVIYGGVSSGASASGSLFVFDTRSQVWNIANPTNSPPSRSLHGAIWRNSDLIIFGGLCDGRTMLNDVWMLATEVIAKPPGKIQLFQNLLDKLYTIVFAMRISLRTDNGDGLLAFKTNYPQVNWDHACSESREMTKQNVSFVEMACGPILEQLGKQAEQLSAVTLRVEDLSNQSHGNIAELLSARDANEKATMHMRNQFDQMSDTVAELRNRLASQTETDHKRMVDLTTELDTVLSRLNTMSISVVERFDAIHEGMLSVKQQEEADVKDIRAQIGLSVTKNELADSIARLESESSRMRTDLSQQVKTDITDASVAVKNEVEAECAKLDASVKACREETTQFAVQQVNLVREQVTTDLSGREERLREEITANRESTKKLHSVLEKMRTEHSADVSSLSNSAAAETAKMALQLREEFKSALEAERTARMESETASRALYDQSLAALEQRLMSEVESLRLSVTSVIQQGFEGVRIDLAKATTGAVQAANKYSDDRMVTAVESLRRDYATELSSVQSALLAAQAQALVQERSATELAMAVLQADLKQSDHNISERLNDLQNSSQADIAQVSDSLNSRISALDASVRSIHNDSARDVDQRITVLGDDQKKTLNELRSLVDQVVADNKTLVSDSSAALRVSIAECEQSCKAHADAQCQKVDSESDKRLSESVAQLDSGLRTVIKSSESQLSQQLRETASNWEHRLLELRSELEAGLQEQVSAIRTEIQSKHETATTHANSHADILQTELERTMMALRQESADALATASQSVHELVQSLNKETCDSFARLSASQDTELRSVIQSSVSIVDTRLTDELAAVKELNARQLEQGLAVLRSESAASFESGRLTTDAQVAELNTTLRTLIEESSSNIRAEARTALEAAERGAAVAMDSLRVEAVQHADLLSEQLATVLRGELDVSALTIRQEIDSWVSKLKEETRISSSKSAEDAKAYSDTQLSVRSADLSATFDEHIASCNTKLDSLQHETETGITRLDQELSEARDLHSKDIKGVHVLLDSKVRDLRVDVSALGELESQHFASLNAALSELAASNSADHAALRSELGKSADSIRRSAAAVQAQNQADMRNVEVVWNSKFTDFAAITKSDVAGLRASLVEQQSSLNELSSRCTAVSETASLETQRQCDALRGELESAKKLVDVGAARADASRAELRNLFTERVDSLDRAMRDSAAQVPSIETYLATLRSEMSLIAVQSSKQVDNIREEMTSRAVFLVDALKPLNRLPTDIANLGERLAIAEKLLPKDQGASQIAAREALAEALNARIAQLEQTLQETSRSSQTTLKDSLSSIGARIQSLEADAKQRTVALSDAVSGKMETMQESLARFKQQVDQQFKDYSGGFTGRLNDLDTRLQDMLVQQI